MEIHFYISFNICCFTLNQLSLKPDLGRVSEPCIWRAVDLVFWQRGLQLCSGPSYIVHGVL